MPSLKERLADVLGASAVLRAVPPEDVPGHATQLDGVEAAARGLEARVGVDAPSEALAAEVQDLEAALFRRFAAVPMELLRLADTRGVASEALARCARLLASRPSTRDAMRWDQFEEVVGRMLRVERADGGFDFRPESDAARVLAFALPGEPHAASATARERAVSEFREATAAVERVTSLDEFFEQGLYADLYGYKYALRNDRLDRAILYAAMAFHARMTEVVRRLAGDGAAVRGFHVRLAEVERSTREVLGAGMSIAPPAAQASGSASGSARVSIRPPPAGFSIRPPRPGEAAPSAPGASGASTRPQPRRRLPVGRGVLAAAAVGLAAALAAVGLRFSVTPDLLERPRSRYTQAELDAVSPLLTGVRVRESDEGATLVGFVTSEWSSLTDEARAVSLDEVRSGIARLGIRSAVLVGNGTRAVVTAAPPAVTAADEAPVEVAVGGPEVPPVAEPPVAGPSAGAPAAAAEPARGSAPAPVVAPSPVEPPVGGGAAPAPGAPE